MLHPLELMSLVVGQQAIDWSHLEKVRAYKIYLRTVYTHNIAGDNSLIYIESTAATRLYSSSWVTGLTSIRLLVISR